MTKQQRSAMRIKLYGRLHPEQVNRRKRKGGVASAAKLKASGLATVIRK